MVSVLVVHYKLQQEITKKEIWLFYYWFWINFSLQSFATCLSTVISRSLFCTIWQIESPLLSYKIPKFMRSKNIFRPGIISGNLPKSRVSLRHYLRSLKLEVRQFSNLIIPIHSSFGLFFLSQSVNVLKILFDWSSNIEKIQGSCYKTLFCQESV